MSDRSLKSLLLFVLISLLFVGCGFAYAQKSKSTLITEVGTNWPDNTVGAITPALLRSTVIDIINSYLDLGGNSSFSCASNNFVSSAVASPGTTGLTCTQPVYAGLGSFPVRANGSIAASTATTGSVMLGIAVPATPNATGNMHVTVSGYTQNSTIYDGCSLLLKYGTGAAPLASAVATGTSLGLAVEAQNATANQLLPFPLTGYVTNLTVGQGYWFDVNASIATGGQCSEHNVELVVIEE